MNEMTEVSAELNAALARMWAAAGITQHNDGSASTQQWRAEDGWIIEYTTSRITGGPHAGKFAVLGFKPNRRKSPDRWERVYFRGFATRKAARARALVMYGQHSPKWKARQ